MSDNIIDFNDLKNKVPIPGNTAKPLPDIPAFNEAQQLVSDRILRSVIVMQLTVVAMAAAEKAGFDQSKFHMNLDSVERFYDCKLHDVDDDSFNGIWFDWEDGNTFYRIATTVSVEADNETVTSDVDIFRLNPGNEHWAFYENAQWKDYGPSEDYFELLLDDEWDEDDEWDDFYGDDSWYDDEEIDPEDEDSLWALGISSRAITALEKAGIRTVADLTRLSVAEARKIKGIGEKSLSEIVDLLDAKGFELRP